MPYSIVFRLISMFLYSFYTDINLYTEMSLLYEMNLFILGGFDLILILLKKRQDTLVSSLVIQYCAIIIVQQVSIAIDSK